MLIHPSTGGVASTNSYLIIDEPSRQGVIFDAPDHTLDPLLLFAKSNRFDIIGLWLTHGHFDHIADHALVTGSFPAAKVLLHPLDVPKLADPGPQTRMFILPFKIPPRRPDQLVNDGDILNLGESEVHIIHTPGHSPGHVMYHFPKEKILVGGDLIICGAVGRTDLPDADEDQLIDSIQKVYRLCPDDTRLLPGHCSPTTLGEQRKSNPYVRSILAAE